ncbi:MAG: hypothetical protein RMN25_01850 [Anaerolineae bacterium]|nr:hypothetical protein [Thermoflexales bacterium]MDW8406498.1 hypothetical protein [Anaerolineae bacterium]
MARLAAVMQSGCAQAGWLALCLLAGALTTVLAPAERTLGDGIRVVYWHVACTWAGLTGFALLAVLGLVVLLTGRPSWQTWAFAIGCVAAVCFGAGATLSALAAWVNWGGVYWAEPRMRANVIMLAGSVIVLTLATWPLPARLKGALYLAPAALYGALISNTPLVMHPHDPIGLSSSAAIRLTFALLYGLCVGMAAGVVLIVHRRLVENTLPSEKRIT